MKFNLSILLFLCTIFLQKTSAQPIFEVDAKAGWAYSVGSDWPGNQGVASILNLGFRQNKNCFGMTFSYSSLSFTKDDIKYPNQYLSGGIYNERELINKPKFVGRLGGSFNFGGANSYAYHPRYGQS